MLGYSKFLLPYWLEDFPKDKRALLIIDDFRGHIDADVEKEMSNFFIDVENLLSNTIPFRQPMDGSVNSPFKTYYSVEWNEFQFNIDKDTLKLMKITRHLPEKKR